MGKGGHCKDLEDPHALVKANQALGLGLDVLIDFDEMVVNPDSIYMGVSYCSGDEHEPAG